MIIDLPTHDSVQDQQGAGRPAGEGRLRSPSAGCSRWSSSPRTAQSEDPIAAANAASFEHPCRVIVVARGAKRASPRLDAQIRVGGDAGASEVVVLRLYGSAGRPRRVGGRAAAARRCAGRGLVAGRGARGAGRGSRSACSASAGSPTPHPPSDRSRSSPSAGTPTGRATPTSPGPGSPAGAGCSPPTLDQPPHDKITEVTVAGAPTRRPPTCSRPGSRWRLKCPVKRVKSPTKSGPGLHSVVLHRRGRRHHPGPAADASPPN